MQPQPDFSRLIRALKREGPPEGRVPFVELYHDKEVMEELLGEKMPDPWSPDVEARKTCHRMRVDFWTRYGYDYVPAVPNIGFQHLVISGEDKNDVRAGGRGWIDESRGVIETWEDFEKYSWPKPEDIDYTPIEFVSRCLPDGMKIVVFTGGILEWGMNLMGYQPMALALYDAPDLVEAILQRVGELTLAIHKTAVSHPDVGALWLGDDMGHKSGTLISAAHLREYILPWHKRLAEVSHQAGKPFLLHACGNITEIMPDLLNDVGIDAKHSFEDGIQTVEDFYRRYSNRIAVLGGVDLDLLCRGTEEDVRRRTREILEVCGRSGGFALGSGNSVANYINIRNFLAMLDEGNRFYA